MFERFGDSKGYFVISRFVIVEYDFDNYVQDMQTSISEQSVFSCYNYT